MHHNKVWEQLRCIKESSRNAVTPHVHIIPAVNAIDTVFRIKYDNKLRSHYPHFIQISVRVKEVIICLQVWSISVSTESVFGLKSLHIILLSLLPPQIVCITNNDVIMCPWRGYLYAEICWEITCSNTLRKSCFRPEDIRLNTGWCFWFVLTEKQSSG